MPLPCCRCVRRKTLCCQGAEIRATSKTTLEKGKLGQSQMTTDHQSASESSPEKIQDLRFMLDFVVKLLLKQLIPI